MVLLRQIVQIGIWVLIYAVTLTGLAALLFPQVSRIDTRLCEKTLLFTDTRCIVYGRAPLQSNSSKVFFLGASNAKEGFRPELLQPFLPGVDIHNLSVGSANVTEVREVLDLAYDALPSGGTGRNVVVVGMWYGLLAENQSLFRTRWRTGRTDIDVEKLRYGLYRECCGKFAPSFPMPRYQTYLLGLRSFMLMDRLLFWENQKNWLRSTAKALVHPSHKPPLSGTSRAEALTRGRAQTLLHWQLNMGDRSRPQYMSEQFAELSRLVQTVVARGDRVILVDLPLPKWHSDDSVDYREYQARKVRFLSEIAPDPSVKYLDLSGLNDEGDFYDGTHPSGPAAARWTSLLGKAIEAWGGTGRSSVSLRSFKVLE